MSNKFWQRADFWLNTILWRLILIWFALALFVFYFRMDNKQMEKAKKAAGGVLLFQSPDKVIGK